MSSIIKLTISALILIVQQFHSRGIQFANTENWQVLKASAKTEHKYIFINAYATWCGPCKTMDKEVFPLAELRIAFNNKLISFKVQMDKTKNDAENLKSWYADANATEKILSVSGYPTYLFFSPDGD